MRTKLNEWTDKEKETLRKLFPTMGPLRCSEIIGRSKRACQEMAKKLRIKRELIYDNKEEFINMINSCKSYTECIIKLGLSPRCSGNFQTIKKYIKKYEIDISHFTNGFQTNFKEKRNINEILTKNSFFTRSHLKERLYKEGLKKKECEICGLGESWFNGSKIVHILDHINGDPYDNRIENLRIVCPNCNSTFRTNNGRNKTKYIHDSLTGEYKSEKTYKKCECGKVILKDSKFCSKCNGDKQRKVKRPSFEELKKLLKENGNTGVGRIYGVTEACVRKWIKNYENTSVT